ncbi:hypothetical protein Poly24_13950 [Rosistilla carotiformis]|uniref:Uncharacterized protein n=1 Tax=Rosistilla carotiformis TaxID=2528017 RepID=A0A518JQ81_9BACT|nr:hypothetical protein Poly24_13950 [Rosistilla carotiformis]
MDCTGVGLAGVFKWLTLLSRPGESGRSSTSNEPFEFAIHTPEPIRGNLRNCDYPGLDFQLVDETVRYHRKISKWETCV